MASTESELRARGYTTRKLRMTTDVAERLDAEAVRLGLTLGATVEHLLNLSENKLPAKNRLRRAK